MANSSLLMNIATLEAWSPSWEPAWPQHDSDFPVATALPVEECDRLRAHNASLWLLLTSPAHANANGSLRLHCLEHAPVLTHASAVRACVLAVLAALSFVANVATIASIRRNQRDKRAPHAVYALILHLSLADLLVTLLCIGGEAAWSYSVAWLAGNAACKLFKFAQMFCLYLSTFVLVLIGVDRFVVVRYPMKSLNTAKRLNRLIAFAWVLSLILSIPQLVIFHVDRGPFVEEFYQCVTHGFYTEQWQEQLYTTFSLVLMFILPLVILISTYVSTIITISRSERMFKAEVTSGDEMVASEVNRRRLIHRAKTKSLRISVVIVVTFILWWTPYYTMMIIFMFLDPDKHVSEDLQSWIFFFGMSNSLVNPIIYGAFHLWQPKRTIMGSLKSSEYRFRSSLNRQSTLNTKGSTPALHTRGNGVTRDEETTLVSLDEVGIDARRLSAKFLLRCNGVLLGKKTINTSIL